MVMIWSRILEIKKINVNFKKDLGYRCPICQKIILPTDDDGFILDPFEDKIYEVSLCPHLIWCNMDGNSDHSKFGDWAFMYVRPDIAQKIVSLIGEDSVIKQELKNYGIIISKTDISLFLNGKFVLEDKISGLFANLPIIYEQLLPPNACLYQYSYSEFNNIEFAIESLFYN
jgi:hypothetical protein